MDSKHALPSCRVGVLLEAVYQIMKEILRKCVCKRCPNYSLLSLFILLLLFYSNYKIELIGITYFTYTAVIILFLCGNTNTQTSAV